MDNDRLTTENITKHIKYNRWHAHLGAFDEGLAMQIVRWISTTDRTVLHYVFPLFTKFVIELVHVVDKEITFN